MAWSIWDDRPEKAGPSINCGACGLGVDFWVEFTRNEKWFQLCYECVAEAAAEAKERYIEVPEMITKRTQRDLPGTTRPRDAAEVADWLGSDLREDLLFMLRGGTFPPRADELRKLGLATCICGGRCDGPICPMRYNGTAAFTSRGRAVALEVARRRDREVTP